MLWFRSYVHFDCRVLDSEFKELGVENWGVQGFRGLGVVVHQDLAGIVVQFKTCYDHQKVTGLGLEPGHELFCSTNPVKFWWLSFGEPSEFDWTFTIRILLDLCCKIIRVGLPWSWIRRLIYETSQMKKWTFFGTLPSLFDKNLHGFYPVEGSVSKRHWSKMTKARFTSVVRVWCGTQRQEALSGLLTQRRFGTDVRVIWKVDSGRFIS